MLLQLTTNGGMATCILLRFRDVIAKMTFLWMLLQFPHFFNCLFPSLRSLCTKISSIGRLILPVYMDMDIDHQKVFAPCTDKAICTGQVFFSLAMYMYITWATLSEIYRILVDECSCTLVPGYLVQSDALGDTTGTSSRIGLACASQV